MSKLKNLLRQTIQNASYRSIGFAHETNTKPNPQMLIMAKASNKTESQKLLKSGCNIIISEKNNTFDNDKNPIGIQIESPTAKIITDLVMKNIDFVIFDHEQTPANAFGDSEIGQILSVNTPDDDQLKILKFIQNIDAVFVGTIPKPFLVKDQLNFRMIAASLNAPLIALVESVPNTNDLIALRNSGILVVLTPNDPNFITEMSNAILAMPLQQITATTNVFSPIIPSTGGSSEEHNL